MQKVAWPATMVSSEGVIEKYLIADRRARPVTIPGRAIGSTRSSDSEFCPKNLNRDSAKAADVPSRRAIAVAASPTLTELMSAVCARSSCSASDHQWVE